METVNRFVTPMILEEPNYPHSSQDPLGHGLHLNSSTSQSLRKIERPRPKFEGQAEVREGVICVRIWEVSVVRLVSGGR